MEWFTRPLLTVGGTEVTLLSVALFLASFVAALMIANVIRAVMVKRILVRTHLDPGVQFAIGQLTYYVLLVLGLMIVLQSAGIGLSSLTVVLGALTVGIGFGLQNIVNNFVSGLILLLERPIQVGDLVEVGDKMGVVKHIGARSTHLASADNVSIIVPNGDLITTKIVNWSLGDPTVAIHVPFNLGFDEDVRAAMTMVEKVAAENSHVLQAPVVLMREIGDTCFRMEVIVITDIRFIPPPRLKSDLSIAIAATFRQHNVAYPWPLQRMRIESHSNGHGENPVTVPLEAVA